ncbi:alpha-hydroxy-acid oxidizing enzyme [Virgisporangium aliadipatigenens]|uniref:Alpha-hydroxy-acid oxidizing enzyme n=1 Tax=Virgisporangium aliadipatigenens TaxID=741659 RepID=A0A8J3YFZ1_9ACTN|nr:alpha-hydroxy acid oxidase [Virgisporangium aliadipatigenens]GIJ44479.1 alpha-hydroxy-acid oxidizing enzyme [Virgisporangium aliadipatigenens]
MPVLTVADYEDLARAKVPASYWGYVSGGSGTERSMVANRAAFDRFALRPRVLVDVSTIDTSVELLGARLAGPVLVAPTAYHRMMHPEGELATARGAAEAGALYVTSYFSTQPLPDVAAAAGAGARWMQLYWLKDRELFGSVVDGAVAAGFTALVLTVDTPVVGRRLRDLRNELVLGPELRAANVGPALGNAMRRGEAGRSAVADAANRAFDASITWDDLAWLRERGGLPVVLKGILTGEDAALAVAHGAAAVIVSNHGGRQLDHAVGGMDALPEVVEAVAGRVPVLVDGGFRTGTEVLMALAAGASAVLVGRPVLWGLAVDGAAGVRGVLDMLHTELAQAMALTGRPTIARIDGTALRTFPR